MKRVKSFYSEQIDEITDQVNAFLSQCAANGVRDEDIEIQFHPNTRRGSSTEYCTFVIYKQSK